MEYISQQKRNESSVKWMGQVQNTNTNIVCKYKCISRQNLKEWYQVDETSGKIKELYTEGGRRVHKHLLCLGNQSMLWVGIKLKVNFAIRWVMWLRTDWTKVWKPGGLALHMSDKKICWQQQLHLYHIIVSVSKSQAVKVYICRLTPHAKGSIELLKLRLRGSDIPAWYFPSVPIWIVIQFFDWYNFWLSWYQ